MIASINNEKIKEYAKLNDKKYRKELGLFLIEGEHLVREAQQKDLVKEILLLEGEKNDYGKVTFTTKEILKKISNLTTPPKVIAVCHKMPNAKVQGNVVILEAIANPGNLGTIIRSAVAFNYETVILCPRTVDIYNSKVIRATEGMLFNVNIIIADLPKIISKLKKDKYQIIGSEVSAGDLPKPKVQAKHAIIIGSEAKGVSPAVLALCHQKLTIKMNPLCESLNAGVAASILMYELNK